MEIHLNPILGPSLASGQYDFGIRAVSSTELTASTVVEATVWLGATPQLSALCEQLKARLTRREMSRRMKLVVGFFVVSGLVLWLGLLATGAMVRSVVGT